ncbi:hypothetical protein [Ferruginibacter sp.]
MRFFLLAMLLMLFAISCKKNKMEEPDLFTRYRSAGINGATIEELREAREATARYQSLDSAIADGYADIAVDVEHMGHHYMKTSLVDSVFDKLKPEILVYNRDHDNHAYLVAVEYAVPLTYAKPDGFIDQQDVWKGDSGFPFWLLHAWVWAYNPGGVFNWTNETVHMH